MAITSKAEILISDKPLINFSDLIIEQKLNTHHKFSVVQTIPSNSINESLEKAKKYIGGKVLITIKPSQIATNKELQFRGVVHESKLLRADGASAKILINGYSPTFQMSGLPNTQSYSEKTLSEIAKKIINLYPSDKLEPTVNIDNDVVYPYTVQYKESDFDFLARLAARRCLWFYYNGRELIFGKPKSQMHKLKYGEHIPDFNIEMKTKPINCTFLGYDPASKTYESFSSDAYKPQASGIMDYLVNNSKSYFPTKPYILYNNHIEEEQINVHLKNRLSTQLDSQISDLLTATGTTNEHTLKLGDKLNIYDPGFTKSSSDVTNLVAPKDYGTYYIISLLHIFKTSGEYYNIFEGIPSDSKAPPYGNIFRTPNTEAQVAVVVDNNDPKGLSRIRVQFPWQKQVGEKTPWIRVVTPYAGKGKGMHILPEIGEEVIVDFENSNAEKPIVLGALFNGIEKSGYGGEGNYNKGFQTASGNKLLMNDEQGSVLLTDQGPTAMMFDGKGNSAISSELTNTIAVGTTENEEDPPPAVIHSDSEGNITLSAKKTITLQVGGNVIFIDGDKGEITINGVKKVLATSPEKVDLETKNASVIAQTQLKIEGGKIQSQSNEDTIISSGGIVKINS